MARLCTRSLLQSLKLLANPTVSVGRLMEEKQWEGPTSHQAAVARDRLARDSYTMTEAEAVDWARRAVSQQGHSMQDPVAQLPSRVGCYLALRASELMLGAGGLTSCAGSVSGNGRGAPALAPAVGGRLVVVQLLEMKQSTATVVTLDKQTAHAVDLPQTDSSHALGALLVASGAPYYVLTPPYEHRFTPGGSVSNGSSGHLIHANSAPYTSMARTSSLPLAGMDSTVMPRNSLTRASTAAVAPLPSPLDQGEEEDNAGMDPQIPMPAFGTPPGPGIRRTSRGVRGRNGSSNHHNNHSNGNPTIKLEHQQLSMSLPTPSFMMMHHHQACGYGYGADAEGASGMSGCYEGDGCSSPGHSKLKRLASVAAELCMSAGDDGGEADAGVDTSTLSAAGAAGADGPAGAGTLHVRKRRAQGGFTSHINGHAPGMASPELGLDTASPPGTFDAPNLPQLLRQLLINPLTTATAPTPAMACTGPSNVIPAAAPLITHPTAIVDSSSPCTHLHSTLNPAQQAPIHLAAAMDRRMSSSGPQIPAMPNPIPGVVAPHQSQQQQMPADADNGCQDAQPMEFSRTGSPSDCHQNEDGNGSRGAAAAATPAVDTPAREEGEGTGPGEEEPWGGAVAAKLLPMIRQAAAQQVCVDHLARLLVERQARITALETALADRDRQLTEMTSSRHLQAQPISKQQQPSPAVTVPGNSGSNHSRKGLGRTSIDAGSGTQAGTEADGEDAGAAIGNRTPSPPQPALLMLATTASASSDEASPAAGVIAPGHTAQQDEDEDEVRPYTRPSATAAKGGDVVMAGPEVRVAAGAAGSAAPVLGMVVAGNGSCGTMQLAAVAAAGAAASARCAALEGDLRDMQRELQAQRDLTGQLTALNAQLCERGQRLQLERNQALAALAAAAAQGHSALVAA